MKVEYVLYFKDEKKIIFKYIFIKGKLHFLQELVIKFMNKVSIKKKYLQLWMKFSIKSSCKKLEEVQYVEVVI